MHDYFNSLTPDFSDTKIPNLIYKFNNYVHEYVHVRMQSLQIQSVWQIRTYEMLAFSIMFFN